MAESLENFPLFPLGIVLLPGELVALHVFEERYKLMIGECIETDTEFGIIWLSDERLHEIGCTARVTDVVERFDDGRMNIVVTGELPFRLVRRVDDLPYPAGDIDVIDFESDGAPSLAAEARRHYADLVERVTDERPDAETLDGMDAFAMAATIELEPAAKQELLETESEDERLTAAAKLFARTLERLDDSEHSAEVAKSNGHLRR